LAKWSGEDTSIVCVREPMNSQNMNVVLPDYKNERLGKDRGHMAINSKCMGPRKSQRKTISNRRLRDYVWEQKIEGIFPFLSVSLSLLFLSL